MLFICVASRVGIADTSFIAVLGAAGLAVGLARQGRLANFAGGALILLFKPYWSGDLSDSQSPQRGDIFMNTRWPEFAPRVCGMRFEKINAPSRLVSSILTFI